MSATSRKKNRQHGEKKGHRREAGRTLKSKVRVLKDRSDVR